MRGDQGGKTARRLKRRGGGPRIETSSLVTYLSAFAALAMVSLTSYVIFTLPTNTQELKPVAVDVPERRETVDKTVAAVDVKEREREREDTTSLYHELETNNELVDTGDEGEVLEADEDGDADEEGITSDVTQSVPVATGVYALSATTIGGQKITLDRYGGYVSVVVNVASH